MLSIAREVSTLKMRGFESLDQRPIVDILFQHIIDESTDTIHARNAIRNEEGEVRRWHTRCRNRRMAE